MKILITGGCGFLGKNIYRYLRAQNYNVWILDNISPASAHKLLPELIPDQYVQHDLTEFYGLSPILFDFDVIIHLAAISDTRAAENHPLIDLEVSTIATWNIVLALEKNPRQQRLLFTSSQHVYGHLDSSLPKRKLNEQAVLRPSSTYGAGKVASEAIVSVGSQSGNIEGIILRLTNVVGKHQNYGVLPDLIRKLNRNAEVLPVLGNGAPRRNFLYIDDLCSAVNHLLTLPIDKRLSVFNVSSKGVLTIQKVAEVVLDELDLSSCKIAFSSKLETGWKGDPGSIILDSKKIRQTGWIPSYQCEPAVRKATRDLWQEFKGVNKTN